MKKVTFLLLTILLISTVFVGCDHGNKSSNLNKPTVQDLPEVNPEYSGSANPSQEDILRIVLLKEDGTELNATEDIELDLGTFIKAVVKNHKNEVVNVDDTDTRFKFEVTDKKDSVFTFPNDESGPNPELYSTQNLFTITGKKEASGVVLKVTHPKAFYTKKQIFNIKKIDRMWDSEYNGDGESLNAKNEGFISQNTIFKFKDNNYEVYEKMFIKRKLNGKEIKMLIFDGLRRGHFKIQGSKLILDNKHSFKIVKSETSIKLAEDSVYLDGSMVNWPFTYRINKTKGNPIFN